MKHCLKPCSKKSGSLLLWCLLIAILPLQSQHLYQKNIQLKRTNGTIQDFLEELNELYQINFSYDENILPKKKLNLDKTSWQLQDLLQNLTQKTYISFQYINGQVVLKKNGKVRISGTIKEQAEGEHLLGATVYIPELNIGSVSDDKGHYQMVVPPGKYTSVFSYIGHQSLQQKLYATQNLSLNVSLYPQIDALQEVVIQSPKEEGINLISTTSMSTHTLSSAKIKSLPMLAGEPDVLKSVQWLPGTQNATVGTTNFSVRGGNYDQNLILFDGIPIYNTAHAMGFFSTINPDIVQNIRFYKGALPVKYGGRLSSVVAITGRNGNPEKFQLSGGVGISSSRLTMEGPLGKRASFIIAGRHGYPGDAASKLLNGPFPEKLFVRFQDVHAKFNIRLNKNNQLNFSAFTTKDESYDEFKYPSGLSFSRSIGFVAINHIFEYKNYDWSSFGGALTWTHQYTPRLNSQLKLFVSNLDNGYVFDKPATASNYTNQKYYQWEANLQQVGTTLNFNYKLAAKNSFNFGIFATRHHFQPGRFAQNDLLSEASASTKRALEAGIYVDYQWYLGTKWYIQSGARLSGFYNLGEGMHYTYNAQREVVTSTKFKAGSIINSAYGIEPRLLLRYSLNTNASLKFSYLRSYQYLHQVSSSAIALPSDVWLPTDNNIQPRFADQVALGYAYQFGKNKQFTLSSEIYYKKTHGTLDYKDNAQLLSNEHIINQLRVGTNDSYGLELMLAKNKGRFTGWVSYTLSKSENHIPGINQGKAYAPRFDRRHNLLVVASHTLGKRWLISANYSYMSGAPITAPRGQFISDNHIYNFYTERNSYRLPDFHQLSLNVTLKSKQRKKWQGEWIFGVTNLYNQQNPVAIVGTHISWRHSSGNGSFMNMNLLGLIPSVTYNFKF